MSGVRTAAEATAGVSWNSAERSGRGHDDGDRSAAAGTRGRAIGARRRRDLVDAVGAIPPARPRRVTRRQHPGPPPDPPGCSGSARSSRRRNGSMWTGFLIERVSGTTVQVAAQLAGWVRNRRVGRPSRAWPSAAWISALTTSPPRASQSGVDPRDRGLVSSTASSLATSERKGLPREHVGHQVSAGPAVGGLDRRAPAGRRCRAASASKGAGASCSSSRNSMASRYMPAW